MIEIKTMQKFKSNSLPSLKQPLPSVKAKLNVTRPTFTKVNTNEKLTQKSTLKNKPLETIEQFSKKATFSYFRTQKKALNNLFKTSNQISPNKKELQPTSTKNHLQKIEKDKKQNQKKLEVGLVGKGQLLNKSCGVVQTYAVNSHSGYFNSLNENRLAIVTNFIKYKHKSISFFSIYEGKNGMKKAQYMRDNFHLILLHDSQLIRNFQQAVKNSLGVIEDNFQLDQQFKSDTSKVNFIICIFINQTMHLIRSGGPRAIISMKLGGQISNPQLKKNYNNQSKKGKQQNILDNIDVRSFEINNSFDFVLLGSIYDITQEGEGLHLAFQPEQIGRKIWEHLFKEKQQGLEKSISKGSQLICNKASLTMKSKSISIVIIGLPGVQKCLAENDALDLPYV